MKSIRPAPPGGLLTSFNNTPKKNIMAKPKNLKKAFEEGYIIDHIGPRFDGGETLKIMMKRRFYRPNAENNFVTFFISRKYFVSRYARYAKFFGLI